MLNEQIYHTPELSSTSCYCCEELSIEMPPLGKDVTS